MNPQITPGGRSFKGAYLYYMHDKEAQTRNRIAWTHTCNMITADPDKAWKVMAYTAKAQAQLKQSAGHGSGGRPSTKPVMAYSLNWHPQQAPSSDHILETALQSLKVLGLEEHEALIVAHSDTPHRHVHVIANRIHPLSGLIASDSNDYYKLSAFAREYAKQHGLPFSPQREANHEKREKGKAAKYRDPNISEAWKQSHNGESFQHTLVEKGYTLARGNKRIVVIDPYGKIINPARHIEGATGKAFKEKLADLRYEQLPDATHQAKIIAQRHAQHKQNIQEKASTPSSDNLSPLENAPSKNMEGDHKIYELEELRLSISILQRKLMNPGFLQKISGITRYRKRKLHRLREKFLYANQRWEDSTLKREKVTITRFRPEPKQH